MSNVKRKYSKMCDHINGRYGCKNKSCTYGHRIEQIFPREKFPYKLGDHINRADVCLDIDEFKINDLDVIKDEVLNLWNDECDTRLCVGVKDDKVIGVKMYNIILAYRDLIQIFERMNPRPSSGSYTISIYPVENLEGFWVIIIDLRTRRRYRNGHHRNGYYRNEYYGNRQSDEHHNRVAENTIVERLSQNSSYQELARKLEEEIRINKNLMTLLYEYMGKSLPISNKYPGLGSIPSEKNNVSNLMNPGRYTGYDPYR